MKQATKKAAKKAPAKKAATKVAKKTVKKTAVKKAVEAAVKKVATKKTVAKKAPAKKAAKKTVASKSSKTVVVANVDVGFGNLLYLRGDAPGLSWKKGVPMECKNNSSWSITMSGVKDTFEYKVLVNDLHWAVGSNDKAKPGSTNSSSPSF